MTARRIGRHVVLQGDRDVDQLTRHGVSSLIVLVVVFRFFKIPIFSSSMVARRDQNNDSRKR
jgi:hypothetical protein